MYQLAQLAILLQHDSKTYTIIIIIIIIATTTTTNNATTALSQDSFRQVLSLLKREPIVVDFDALD